MLTKEQEEQMEQTRLNFLKHKEKMKQIEINAKENGIIIKKSYSYSDALADIKKLNKEEI